MAISLSTKTVYGITADYWRVGSIRSTKVFDSTDQTTSWKTDVELNLYPDKISGDSGYSRLAFRQFQFVSSQPLTLDDIYTKVKTDPEFNLAKDC